MKPHSAAHTALAALTISFGAASLCAQNTLDTTLAVRGRPRLAVSNTSGEIRVRVGAAGRIRVVAEYERSRIEIDETATRITVRAVPRGRSSDARFDITVPSGTVLELSGVSTDMDVGGVCGEITVNTVSGDVTLDCARDQATVNTVSGDLTLSGIEGGIEASATSGDVWIRSARGRVRATTVSGDVTLEQVESPDIEATTVSGEVLYTGRIVDNGRYRFEAHSGDVTVRISGPLNATVTVSTFSGEFESDFPIELQPGSRISREWTFRQGSGSARIRLQSFSGTMNLRRLSGDREE